MGTKCKNIGCTYNTDEGQELCIFHQPMDNKSVDKMQFMDILELQIKNKDYNFNSYKIPYGVSLSDLTIDDILDFSDAEIRGHVNLSNTTFSRHAVFNGVKFYNGIDLSDATFNDGSTFNKTEFYENVNAVIPPMRACIFARNATFKKGLNFIGAKFFGYNADFWGANFEGGAVFFSDCKFSDGKAIFNEAIFNDCDVFFENAEFLKDGAIFGHCKFPNNPVSFNGAKFLDGLCDFSHASFEADIKFQNCEIKDGLSFVDTRFGEKSSFYFTNPNFLSLEKSNVAPKILFERVQFRPFQTFFENITFGRKFIKEELQKRPILLFRYCNLKDVYFANNHMSLISFLSSAFFEDMRRVNNEWIIENKPKMKSKRKYLQWISKYLPKLTRANQGIDEHIYRAIYDNNNSDEKKDIIKFYKFELARSFFTIASIYRRFKASDDHAKDYRGAGRHYFNEFEMKRLGFKESAYAKKTDDIESKSIQNGENSGIDKIVSFGKYVLYSLYKLFTGYGNKPLLSFGWFCIMTIIFSAFHLFNGLKIVDEICEKPTHIYHFDWTYKIVDIGNFGDFCNQTPVALKYTLYRILPQAYLPFGREGIVPLCNGPWDIALSIITTIVLLLLLVFTGIGFKRHFRRF